jgi:predicted SprT family Zn-dependent metalloprotease
MPRKAEKIREPAAAPSATRLRNHLSLWVEVWNLPGLEGHTQVAFSPRLRRALGNCDVSKLVIRLNPVLRSGPRRKLLEALCHEAAHIAVHERFGKVRRPHGVEWQ